MNKNYPTPSLAWIQVTGYMHDWLRNEFGGAVLIYEKPVLSISHLQGSRNILRMETIEDMSVPVEGRMSLSAMRMDCLQLGIEIGPDTMEKTFKVTKDYLNSFMPVECPRMALTKYGVLRPWNRETAFGKQQAFALVKLLRDAFWKAVEEHYNLLVAEGHEPHTAIELITSFCDATGTSEVYLDDLRREWQRRISRNMKMLKC